MRISRPHNVIVSLSKFQASTLSNTIISTRESVSAGGAERRTPSGKPDVYTIIWPVAM